MSIEKLMMMNICEIEEEETRLNKMYEEHNTQKNDMEIYLDLSDTDNWLMYEEILQDMDYIERELEIIEDYRKYYDYYWDMM